MNQYFSVVAENCTLWRQNF